MLIPALIVLFFSMRKISSDPVEKKFLMREILKQYLKLQAFVLGLYAILFIGVAAIGMVFLTSFFGAGYDANIALSIVWICALAYFAGIIYYYHIFGKIAYRFFFWLNENEKTAHERIKWLNFADFVVSHSEVEKKGLKYYELWGEFYYYTLAVGAIKNPF